MTTFPEPVTINRIMDFLAKDAQDPIESSELDEVEATLTNLEYEIGDGSQQISYEEWLDIRSRPEFESLFEMSLSNRYSGYADDRRSQITGAINLLFSSSTTARATAIRSTATSTRAQIPAEVIVYPPPQDLGQGSMTQETLSQMSPEEVGDYVYSHLAQLQDQNIPLKDRLFYGEVAAKLLLKNSNSSEAAEIYDEMGTLSPQPRFAQAADSARGVAEASDAMRSCS